MVVLLLLLMLVSVGAYFLLQSLNHAAESRTRGEVTTTQALQRARLALIGYAVHYPDKPGVLDLSAGPGYLPCPDTKFDATKVGPGQADLSCASSSGTETGRFPWHTLASAEMVDGSGAPLWYAVSDNFRNNPKQPINSSTRGTLKIDDCSATGEDYVAVIIAPGPALAGQNRAPASYATSDYLEEQNANKGDNCFSAKRSPTNNDQVLGISRHDLLRAVEQRVMNDVAQALARYRRDPDGDDVNGVDPDCAAATPDCDDGYPWLSPFTNPSTSNYAGVVGTTRGLLPLRQPGVSFNAPFSASWALSGGTFTTSGALPPSEICLRSTSDTSCASTAFATPVALAGTVIGTAGGEWSIATCISKATQQLICTATRTVLDLASSRRLERTYELTLTKIPYAIVPPTATTTRIQQFILSGGTLPASSALALKESDAIIETDGSRSLLGVAALSLTSGTPFGFFQLLNIPFDLEIADDDTLDSTTRRSPGELPAWFTANGWQRLHLVAYAEAHAPGDPASDCNSPPGTCLTVQWTRVLPLTAVTLNKVSGVVVGAGAALVSQSRPSTALSDYFEGANASGGLSFEKRAPSATFNDRLLQLDPK